MSKKEREFNLHWMKKMGLGILKFFIVMVLIYLGFRWFERANVWIPSRTLEAKPSDIDLVYEDVYLTTPDGVKIHGWYIPSATPIASLLFCHGNGGNISHRLESLRQFHSLSFNVLIFDYRGYGQSTGSPSERGTYLDAHTAYEWLHKREDELPMILFGRSLGAAIAIDLAVKVKATALICESSFTSIGDIGKELFPLLPIRYLQTIYYDSLTKIPKVKMPVLVIHSRDDELVPYHHGKRLFDAASPPKEFLTIHGRHNEGYIESEKEYLQGISAFLKKYGIYSPDTSVP